MNLDHNTSNILGLTTSEKKLLNSVTNSEKSISNISRVTKIPRTSLLYMLRKLENRNLVKIVPQGKRTAWKAVTDHLPSNFQGEVEIRRGRDNLFEIFKELSSLPRNTRVFALRPDKSLRNVLKKHDIDDLLKINERIKKNRLVVEVIVHEKSVQGILQELGKNNGQKLLESFIGRLEDYVKIPDEFADVESEIYMYRGTAYIINWKKEIALEIHDKDIVDLLQAMLSCVKELGIRYSQNEKMRKAIPEGKKL